jgi:hypothetical protein
MAEIIPIIPVIRQPGPDDRLAIVGRTGSGKTQAAIWHLSRANFETQPWVILDYKGDELIYRIERAEPTDLDTVPQAPGIYILTILPGEEEELSNWFHQVWEQQNVGILVDEGYMIDRNDRWFNACLTQGRSRHIPMIILSQRPVWLSRFVFSEANFLQVFDLTHYKDMDVIEGYIRDDDRKQLETPLEEFNSFYYDVGKRQLETIPPAPGDEKILKAIDDRLVRLQTRENPRLRPF